MSTSTTTRSSTKFEIPSPHLGSKRAQFPLCRFRRRSESASSRRIGIKGTGSGSCSERSAIPYDKKANEAACDFIRRKIAQVVKDAEKARKLTPCDYYARQPLCDGGYFEQFNRDNVDVVGLKETPTMEMTEKGIRTSDGKEHELDVIIFATGCDLNTYC